MIEVESSKKRIEDEIKELAYYGFDDFLKKPFRIEELRERVQRLFDLPPAKVTRPKRDHE